MRPSTRCSGVRRRFSMSRVRSTSFLYASITGSGSIPNRRRIDASSMGCPLAMTFSLPALEERAAAGGRCRPSAGDVGPERVAQVVLLQADVLGGVGSVKLFFGLRQ